MSVVPAAHAASHSSGGNDPLATLGNVTVGTLNAGATVVTTLTATTTTLGATSAGAVTLSEQAAPATPAANKGTLYLEDVAGVTTLRIKFANGQVIDICDDTP